MRIFINDHVGHPFQVQLSRNLASRGHQVLHTFTAGLQTPRGALRSNVSDPPTFSISPLTLSEPFNRYGLIQRFQQEKELGKLLIAKVNEFQPNVVISANTPLGAQDMLAARCKSNGIKFVFWLQDLLGVGIRNNLQKKLPYLGGLIGDYYVRLERRLVKDSGCVVVITEDFVPMLQDAGVLNENINVIHNWAPLRDLPVTDKCNAWAGEHRLDQTFNFIYTGTLGMKHNPEILAELSLAVMGLSHVRVVVISEGLGMDYLVEKKNELDLINLILLPFQPFEALPQVLGTADVLIAILEPDAGVFSVPSKVLTYLCAKRPLLLAVPAENLAARIVDENRAGIVVSPHDLKGVIRAAEKLRLDPEMRQKMSDNGRKYAEINFDIENITNRFERIISEIKH